MPKGLYSTVNPFTELDDLHLAVLLYLFNSPQGTFKTKDVAAELEAMGYIKNTARSYNDPWWSYTPKGKALQQAFIFAEGALREEKEAFMNRTYGLLR